MKFLVDEDVPVKLIRALKSLGHDATRVETQATDRDIAGRAKRESRILITLDKDFTNKTAYPPSEFNIIHVHIHPPDVETIIATLSTVLARVPSNKLQGLIVLRKEGPVRFS